MLLQLEINVTRNCHILADSREKMILKAAGLRLGTTEMVLESHWEMFKDY
jgi:hypothetical protein